MSLSLTLTLSGGAALGAYEAGATAALLEAAHALRRHGEDVSIDAFGGASAGALVALFAAHAEVNGIDPVWLLHSAWVERVSLDLLMGHGARSPLDFEQLTAQVGSLLDPREDDGRPAHRRTDAAAVHPMGLHIALTGLRGLHYPARSIGRLEPVQAATFADWSGFTLTPGGGPEQITAPAGRSPLETALASAANPGAFAPRLLDRSTQRDGYARNGIVDLPESDHLWFTDGGTLQVEPIGRVLTAARRARADAGRDPADQHLALLIDPRSEMPEGAQSYADPRRPPSWLGGIARTLSIIPAQILYDDLRRVEKANSRLVWSDRLAAVLAEHLDEEGTAALRDALGEIESEAAALSVSSSPAEPGPLGEVDDTVSLVRRALRTLTGLHGKTRAETDVISPLVLADDDRAPVSGLLAGEILGDFGGFLERDLRESDFLLGYDCSLTWLRANLERLDVSPDVHDAVLRRVDDRMDRDWRDHNRGETDLSDLAWSSRLGLARLVARMAGVLGRGLWSGLRGT